jgi:hypothetical protein
MRKVDVSSKVPAEKKKEELSLPNTAMMELLRAVHDKGAAFRFKAAGFSMTPSIRNNDVITISPLKEIPPAVGEVVAFRHPRSNRLLIHRVVRKKHGTFFFRGDNLRQTDSHIPRENILGVVTRVERRGRVLSWPDRFRHPLRARLYFRGYLAYTNIRFRLRTALRFIVTGK